jgi:hypothetical protein
MGNIEQMIKSSTHNGLTCDFNSDKHTYTVRETGQRLTSVTTLVKQYIPPFDAPAKAQEMVDKKKPKYAGMTADEIQKQWKEKGETSSYEGTLLHKYLELWPETKGYGFHPRTYRVLLLSKQVDKLFPKLLKRFRLVAAEKIIFSARLGLAGQADLIMADDVTGEGIILDWKSNEKITDEEGAFGNMLPPIDHLKDCDVVKYGLQLGLYEKMLVDEGFYSEFKGYRKSLIHIREMAGKVVKVADYQEEIQCLML